MHFKEVKRMININNLTYEIIEDEREGYNEDAFKARYSEI